NVAAREVEAVLRDGPGVLDAAVVGVPDDLRGQEVKAYIVPAVPQDKADAVVEAAIAHCVANLAAFKVPRYYEIVESLPRTPSEKIAKGELIKAKEDLRTGSFDRVDKVWR
ncbi:MAG: AMP-binding enzyme, partial [Sphingopyxis sp.]